MSNFNIDEAERAELKAYARDELGLTLSMNLREDTMRQRIKDRIEEMKGSENRGQPMKANREEWPVINVAKTSEKGGGAPVFVGLQGKGYTIPRGKPIPVPPGVEYILRVAIKTDYDQDEDTGEMVGIDILSYPYSVVSGHQYLIA